MRTFVVVLPLGAPVATAIFLRAPANETSGHISTPLGARHWWGFPNYARDQDLPLRSWEQLARDHGHYGRDCNRADALRQCGDQFVCKANTCVECTVARDCMEHHICVASLNSRRLCIPRDLAKQWTSREAICTVLIVVTAMLSAAAGMGGGGVYVPLLLLLLGLSAKEAVPLSQAMILGGAIVNVLMFCGDRHPRLPHRSKIDYDVIMMLNPGLAAGVTLGVMVHLISPQWLIVSTLLVTLVIALQKSLTKGMQAWRKESEAFAASAGAPLGGDGQQRIQLKGVDLENFARLASGNTKPLILIGGCWLTFLSLSMFKAPQCSTIYWLQHLGMLIACVIFTYVGAVVLRSQRHDEQEKGDIIQWTSATLWLYPLLSVVAGFLGGFLGIGGGIIMGPLLLELGMSAEVNQATTAMFVFLSSSLATIHFAMLDKAMPQFVVWFTFWVFVSTFVGQTLIDYILRRYQRSSIIVLSIAAIIAGSLAMMSVIGVQEVYGDIQRGAHMGFKPHQLCDI